MDDSIKGHFNCTPLHFSLLDFWLFHNSSDFSQNYSLKEKNISNSKSTIYHPSLRYNSCRVCWWCKLLFILFVIFHIIGGVRRGEDFPKVGMSGSWVLCTSATQSSQLPICICFLGLIYGCRWVGAPEKEKVVNYLNMQIIQRLEVGSEKSLYLCG